MPVWSDNPLWTDAENINSGNQFTPADGLTAYDLNRIIHNLIYLKKHGGGTSSSDIFSNITTSYISIIPSYDAIGPILNYTTDVPVYNNSGVIFISPANKDTSLQCSKHLQSVQVDVNNNIQFAFNTLPTAEALSFRFVTIPTAEGNIVPVFDVCWSESAGGGTVFVTISNADIGLVSNYSASEIKSFVDDGKSVFAVLGGNFFQLRFSSDYLAEFSDTYVSIQDDSVVTMTLTINNNKSVTRTYDELSVESSGGGSVGSISLVDDGEGNFTIVTTGGGTVDLVDDGEGNFTLIAN